MLFVILNVYELEALQGKVRCSAIIAGADNNTVYTAYLVDNFCFQSTLTGI